MSLQERFRGLFKVAVGTGSPEGVEKGSRFSTYWDSVAGALYLKVQHAQSTFGWQQIGSGGGSAVVQVGAPVSPVDGDAWVEASGVSPNRSIALKYRDGSTTVTIAEVNL